MRREEKEAYGNEDDEEKRDQKGTAFWRTEVRNEKPRREFNGAPGIRVSEPVAQPQQVGAPYESSNLDSSMLMYVSGLNWNPS